MSDYCPEMDKLEFCGSKSPVLVTHATAIWNSAFRESAILDICRSGTVAGAQRRGGLRLRNRLRSRLWRSAGAATVRG